MLIIVINNCNKRLYFKRVPHITKRLQFLSSFFPNWQVSKKGILPRSSFNLYQVIVLYIYWLLSSKKFPLDFSKLWKILVPGTPSSTFCFTEKMHFVKIPSDHEQCLNEYKCNSFRVQWLEIIVLRIVVEKADCKTLSFYELICLLGNFLWFFVIYCCCFLVFSPKLGISSVCQAVWI